MAKYEILALDEIFVPGLANKKFQDLSSSELDGRTIGGDKGDLEFRGYTLCEERNRTILHKPVLYARDGLTYDEAKELAQEILDFSFEAIGLETVEHR
jgi:hypothetical protein